MTAYLESPTIRVKVRVQGEWLTFTREEVRQLKKDFTEAARLHRIADKHRAAMYKEVWA